MTIKANVLDAPFERPNLTDVCHIASTPTQAVCGEAIDPAEPLCCDDALPCGRVACPTCDRLVVEATS